MTPSPPRICLSYLVPTMVKLCTMLMLVESSDLQLDVKSSNDL